LKVALNTINITYIEMLTCELNIFSWILHCVKISSKYSCFLFSGHGPFSHLFDGKFIPTVRPNKKWKVSYVFINIKVCVVCYSITNTLASHCPAACFLCSTLYSWVFRLLDMKSNNIYSPLAKRFEIVPQWFRTQHTSEEVIEKWLFFVVFMLKL